MPKGRYSTARFRLNNCFRAQSYALWNYCAPTGHYWVLWPFYTTSLTSCQIAGFGYTDENAWTLADFVYLSRLGAPQESISGPLLFHVLCRRARFFANCRFRETWSCQDVEVVGAPQESVQGPFLCATWLTLSCVVFLPECEMVVFNFVFEARFLAEKGDSRKSRLFTPENYWIIFYYVACHIICTLMIVVEQIMVYMDESTNLDSSWPSFKCDKIFHENFICQGIPQGLHMRFMGVLKISPVITKCSTAGG